MDRGAAVLLFSSLLLSGCTPAMQNTRSRSSLESRAAFDLQCPKNALTLEPLAFDVNEVVTTYGVKGCGRRATYVRLADSAWLMNPPAGAPAPTVVTERRIPAEPRPPPVPLPPSAAPSAEPAPPPSGSVERSPERPPSSLKPGQRAPRLPDLPGQGERPSPLGPSR